MGIPVSGVVFVLNRIQYGRFRWPKSSGGRLGPSIAGPLGYTAKCWLFLALYHKKLLPILNVFLLFFGR